MRRLHSSILGLGILAAMSGIVAQAQPGQEQRVNRGVQQAGNAIAGGAGRYHLMAGGAVLDETTVSALFDEILRTRPASVGEVRALLKSMKIDAGMPNRISMNVTVPKQTQGATFGERSADRSRPATAANGAVPAAEAASGRASGAREIVILLCNDPAEEQEALRLFAFITAAGEETSQTPARLKTRHDAAMSAVNNIRRAAAPGGREWLLVSEERSR
jgi:hypothetical protein